MKAITRQWLDAAYDDLQTIVKLIHETTLSNIVAFHAQQVIEKTFKAYIE
jgi:HEPN domain-containing protein